MRSGLVLSWAPTLTKALFREHLSKMHRLTFPEFVESCEPGYLFFRVGPRGPWKGIKYRLIEFSTSIVSDRNVQPNYGWRHCLKTIGMEVEIEHRVLDAIQGQVSRCHQRITATSRSRRSRQRLISFWTSTLMKYLRTTAVAPYNPEFRCHSLLRQRTRSKRTRTRPPRHEFDAERCANSDIRASPDAPIRFAGVGVEVKCLL